jgi:hypothetical protein
VPPALTGDTSYAIFLPFPTWNRALRGDVLRLLPHDAQHAGCDHVQRGHDARLSHGSRPHSAWLLPCDAGLRVHGALPPGYDVPDSATRSSSRVPKSVTFFLRTPSQPQGDWIRSR